METIIEKAAKGQRGAMETLYKNNKQTVFYVAQKLLFNDRQAKDAAVTVFCELWSDVAALKIATEKEFADMALEKTVTYCKKMMQKNNTKAFRIPQNKNFKLVFADTAFEGSGDKEDLLLKQLPELHRFIFVLRALGFDCKRTADVLSFKEGLVRLAWDVEKENIEGLLLAAKSTDSYEKFTSALAEGANHAVVPAEADEQVSLSIDVIAKPIEQKQKKKHIIMGAAAIAAGLCIVVGIIIAILVNGKGTTAGEAGSEVTGTALENGEDITNDEADTGDAAQTGGLDETLTYYADIDIKDYGKITIKLDQKSAPISAENFVNLANSGFYDGLTFHRIMEGFMMQGGDPDGNGTGGSEKTIVGEFEQNGYENPLSHTRGAVSMARSNDFDSASSQFFIVHEDSTFLDGQYAVFGYVTEGMDVVDAVCETAEPTDSNGTIPAEAQPVISSITIRTENDMEE